jgi:hypothetical protein
MSRIATIGGVAVNPASGALADATQAVHEECYYVVSGALTVDGPTTLYTGQCILFGIQVTAALSAHVTVIMRQEALRQVAAHSLSDLHCELGGALLGKPYQHNGSLYVEVQAALDHLLTVGHGQVFDPHQRITRAAWGVGRRRVGGRNG